MLGEWKYRSLFKERIGGTEMNRATPDEAILLVIVWAIGMIMGVYL